MFAGFIGLGETFRGIFLAKNANETPVNADSLPIFKVVGDAFTLNGVLAPSTVSALVFSDFNDNVQVDFGEAGIAGVSVTLKGTDDLGNPVTASQPTDASGAYVFLNLRPGRYTITEARPADYIQGIISIGTCGGTVALD